MPETKKQFTEDLLSDKDREVFKTVRQRIQDLQDFRKDQFGVNIENIWSDADKDYVPHRLKSTQQSKKFIVTDEEKGLRGALVRLGSNDWQSDISKPNVFVKINTALSILVDQNPAGVFTAVLKKFQATTNLIKQLYQRSWEVAKSKQQLKLFIFNLSKYGWAVARTYPYKLTRNTKVLKSYNEDDPDKNEYEDKTVTVYNDIMRENLDPWNVWIDDMAKPNNEFSIRDWAWRKVYAFDAAEEEFGKYKLWDYVHPGGNTSPRINETRNNAQKKFKERELVEVYFYENVLKDLFVVIVNGVPIIIEPLPISDDLGLKKLSLWQTYWLLRDAECPYGVGIYESIRYDQAILDRFRNQNIDQLSLSIYKMFFYQGTQQLTDTGDIKISPGVGKQVLDPKNISWLQIPGPGAESWKGLELFQKDIDEASGIGDPLLGEITGKTAFELAQAKESALKRLKTPLENITDALNIDGYITISLIQLLYSVPETYQISDPDLIDAYLKEIEGDEDLYSRDGEDVFNATVYREFPLNLDKDEKGNLIETNETKFFRVKPRFLQWQGIINIKSQSILSPSKQVEKALEMEMYNVLIPLLAQPPQIYSKIAKNIVKSYDKDPKDILPDIWLQDQQQEPLIVPNPTMQALPQGNPTSSATNQTTTAPRLTSSPQIPAQPQGLASRIMSRLVKPFR